MQTKSKRISASEFNALTGIEYFHFEEDFVEKNIRCIPMIVRFKLDLAGIKLKLDEWNRFIVEERIELATRSCNNKEEAKSYRQYLAALIQKRCRKEATDLTINQNPGWAESDKVPELLLARLSEDDLCISLDQWNELTNLQRFALLKLCRPGHESKNFKKALKEFGLTSPTPAFAG
jgi:hypothetical protein